MFLVSWLYAVASIRGRYLNTFLLRLSCVRANIVFCARLSGCVRSSKRVFCDCQRHFEHSHRTIRHIYLCGPLIVCDWVGRTCFSVSSIFALSIWMFDSSAFVHRDTGMCANNQQSQKLSTWSKKWSCRSRQTNIEHWKKIFVFNQTNKTVSYLNTKIEKKNL